MIKTAGIGEALEVMKKNGLKITNQRSDMLQYLADRQDYYLPIKEIDLFLRQTYKHMSYETVYRNVQELEKISVLETRNFKNGLCVKYQCDFKNLKHCHFICEKCRRVIELKRPDLTDFQKQIPDCEINSTDFELFGVCADCLAAAV
ncbi:Fur family transcriptional regulator [Oenococcus kitaharae]|uniref:Fe2+/Zn2+ uptake regulation protein n=1 Tax=Oenococcus kitaharae DSM 17330 TaxID=1045004 RepID=G9WG87_9LACO|nr:transcriptional repressor [Oenococcus kitaharae]EHN59695.1 Fe2+/Zn2+ uptake regulation protein [Oenococcus kitaharae DSM 17330]OEY83528.1 Fur family transcriptional regulator [Oenococcus kitaharae]OEY85327.1 Fur family transcriptional regulator [Oenococcus kitaharae]OEY86181.1 Fur family transcriptional regulator [Oenococcus kitaharae]